MLFMVALWLDAYVCMVFDGLTFGFMQELVEDPERGFRGSNKSDVVDDKEVCTLPRIINVGVSGPVVHGAWCGAPDYVPSESLHGTS